MRNQQLSTPNQNYPQKSEVICNYCKKPGQLITNCNVRLNKQQSQNSEISNALHSTDVSCNVVIQTKYNSIDNGMRRRPSKPCSHDDRYRCWSKFD